MKVHEISGISCKIAMYDSDASSGLDLELELEEEVDLDLDLDLRRLVRASLLPLITLQHYLSSWSLDHNRATPPAVVSPTTPARKAENAT